MFKKFKARIFRKRMLKHIRNEDRDKQFVNYDKAKTVLLLFESHYTEKNPEIEKIIKQLVADGKKLIAWGFVDKKEIMTPSYLDYRILHPKDFKFLGEPSKEVLNELLKQDFDLLIDITSHAILSTAYLVVYARAKCKVGMQKEYNNLYDFSINLKQFLKERELTVDDLDDSFLYDQIIFYLKSIQTKD